MYLKCLENFATKLKFAEQRMSRRNVAQKPAGPQEARSGIHCRAHHDARALCPHALHTGAVLDQCSDETQQLFVLWILAGSAEERPDFDMARVASGRGVGFMDDEYVP
jgi:hypothetical protein